MSLPIPTCLVAVRALAEFTARRGDLDLRFTPSPSAQEGMAGHRAVRARRGAEYEAELPLTGSYRHLQVRGRADGYDPRRNQLEEIKTCVGRIERIPDNHRHLHRAQAMLYAALLCAQRGLANMRVAMVYYDIAAQTESVLVETVDAFTLQAYFEQQCDIYLAWADQEAAHRQARDRALGDLAFAHPAFRPGQRELARAVYRGARDGHDLMAEAPTGIGKTIATLFPALKAMPAVPNTLAGVEDAAAVAPAASVDALAAPPTGGIDRLFFLTAKIAGRQLARDALQQLREPAGLPLRVLELTARDQACEYPERACHGESCPLARGFFDRLAAARAAAVSLTAGGSASLTREALRTIALAHSICPYYLGQEMARWSDVVIGDYNHYFDVHALLHALVLSQEWRALVLVDEAHNLLHRARDMYSSSLHAAALDVIRAQAPAALKVPLARLARHWSRAFEDVVAHAGDSADGVQSSLCDSIPEAFLTALQQASGEMADYFAAHASTLHPGLQEFYFDGLHFLRMAENFGVHSLFEVLGSSAATDLHIRNIVPAPWLAPRFASSQSSVLFSATLSPERYYRDMLGLPEDTVQLEVESPFVAEQLTVHLVPDISTRYHDRAASIEPMVALMARQYHRQPGNYLAFFSSFDYLGAVLDTFRQRHPDIEVREQLRSMPTARRLEFLDRFVEGGRGIGFAVLGGSFGEAIDLPGDRLVGAFIATLGLPQLNAVNEQMRVRLETLFGAGYHYTYLFPGLQKVVQAAGRVIRSRQDQGVVYLMDDRYSRTEVRRLLPSWWTLQRHRLPADETADLQRSAVQT